MPDATAHNIKVPMRKLASLILCLGLAVADSITTESTASGRHSSFELPPASIVNKAIADQTSVYHDIEDQVKDLTLVNPRTDEGNTPGTESLFDIAIRRNEAELCKFVMPSDG